MASYGYETQDLGFGGMTNPEADKSSSLLKSTGGGVSIESPRVELADIDPDTPEKETKYSSIPQTEQPTATPTADQNESNIKTKLSLLQESCCMQIKSTPYKSRIIQMPGYEINKENRKWISSVSLATILVLIGLIGGTMNLVEYEVGSVCKSQSDKVDHYLNKYQNITNYRYLKPIGEASQNVTSRLYTVAAGRYSYKYSQKAVVSTIDKQYLFSDLMNDNATLTDRCYDGSDTCFLPEHNRYYDCFFIEQICEYENGQIETKGTKFPTPYRQSESDLKEKADCSKSVWHCVKKPCGKYKLMRCPVCKNYKINCGVDLDLSNGLLLDDDVWDDSLYSNFSNIDYETVTSTANQLLWEIYERANFLGSVYCFYMALMIFIGGPYVMTSTRLSTKIRVQMQRLTKIWFIGVMLLLWYSAELITLFWGLFIIDTDIHLILKFAMIDPCFADSTFITELFQGAAVVCGDIFYSKALYEASQSNLMYYDAVEQTYQYYYWADKAYNDLNPGEDIRYTYAKDSDRIFYDGKDILGDDYGLVYDYESVDCQVSQLLEYVGPTDSDFDFGAFLLFSSAIAALFLQPVLANLFKSVFVMIDPLAPYWGRVEIPYQHDSDVDEAQDNEYRATDGLDEFEADVLRQIHDENAEKRIEAKQAKEDQEMSEVMTYIKHWERTKNVCPLCCWIALLIIILISTFSVAVNSD
eukprot:155485_1